MRSRVRAPPAQHAPAQGGAGAPREPQGGSRELPNGAAAKRGSVSPTPYCTFSFLPLPSLRCSSFPPALRRRASTILFQFVLTLPPLRLSLASPHTQVTIFFSDIVGFTVISSKLEPEKVMDMLDKLYSAFDILATNYGLFKVETIGCA